MLKIIVKPKSNVSEVIGFDNNFLSISKYNDLNGANFENTTSTNYFEKSDSKPIQLYHNLKMITDLDIV